MKRLLLFVRLLVPASLRARMRNGMFDWMDMSWRLRSGVLVRVANYVEWALCSEIFMDGEYDRAIGKLLENRREGEELHVVDLGANVGFFALRLVDLVRRGGGTLEGVTMTLVEANPHLIEGLRRRVVGENQLGEYVEIVQGLVGERSGHGTLYQLAESSHGSIFSKREEVWRTSRVEAVDLDGLLDPAVEIDLLKCDIEGSELRMIENYPELLRRVRVAVFELHHELCDTEECRRLLGDAGFPHHEVIRESARDCLYCVWR